MKKAIFGLALSTLLVAVSFPVDAQQPTKIPRIGFLVLGSASTETARIQAFRQGLREHGYVEGQNIAIEYLYGEGSTACPLWRPN
jgi:putative tryptophan/tyrosine transport system substrate-binding protein